VHHIVSLAFMYLRCWTCVRVHIGVTMEALTCKSVHRRRRQQQARQKEQS